MNRIEQQEKSVVKPPKRDSKDKDKEKDEKPEVDEGANREKWAATYFEKKRNLRGMSRDFIKLRDSTKIVDAVQEKFADKCRYADVPCIDSTRVVLQGRGADADFIHANWMTMPDGFRYILTQGPTDDTIEDFWHMTVTEKCSHILMICNFSEANLIKCARYIPLENKEFRKFGDYRVRRTSKITEPMDDVKHQVFEVTHRTNKAIRSTVNHYQYMEWPDHAAPLSCDSSIKLYKIFRDPSNTHPVIVHCSAGIGRTATFVGIDYGYQKISQNPTVDLLDILREMRKMRAKAVQTHLQFLFIVVAITQIVINEGVQKNDNMEYIFTGYRNQIERNAIRIKKKANKSADNNHSNEK